MTILLLPGLYLVASALAKANGVRFTMIAVDRYRLLPAGLIGVATAAIGLTEAALGGALVAGWWPAAILAAPFEAALAATAFRAARVRGLAECGCHGKMTRLSPASSALVSLIACVAMLAGVLWRSDAAGARLGCTAALASTCLVLAVGLWSWRRGPMVEIHLIRPGRRWRPEWLADVAGAPDPASRDMIMLFLTEGCSVCRAWAKVMAKAQHLPGTLPVIALVGTAADPAGPPADDPADQLIRHKMPMMSLMRLVPSTPIAAVIRDGIVSELWRERIPETIVSALRPRSAM